MLIKLSKIKITIFFCGLLLLLGGCKKKKPHELVDDKAIFVGTWNWIYSTHTHDYCDGDGEVTTDILTPGTEGHEFKIVFEEEGKISYFQDGTLVAEYNTFITTFRESLSCSNLSNSIGFGIAYSYDAEEGNIGGCINNDTIRTIPFEEFLFPYTPGCESYNNYFVKE